MTEGLLGRIVALVSQTLQNLGLVSTVVVTTLTVVVDGGEPAIGTDLVEVGAIDEDLGDGGVAGRDGDAIGCGIEADGQIDSMPNRAVSLVATVEGVVSVAS